MGGTGGQDELRFKYVGVPWASLLSGGASPKSLLFFEPGFLSSGLVPLHLL